MSTVARPIEFDGLIAKKRVQEALTSTGLVVIHQANITPVEQCDFAAKFGEILEEHVHPTIAETPSISAFSNDPKHGFVAVGGFWHADGSFRKNPAKLSFFLAKEAPAEGACTRFIDMRGVYQTLTEPERLTAHRIWIAYREKVSHPLVCRLTDGSAAIYLTPDICYGAYRDMGTPSVLLVMQKILTAIVTAKSITVATKPGEMLVWDNHRVSHCAQPAKTRELRVVHRVTTVNEGPEWIGGRERPDLESLEYETLRGLI